MPIPLREESGFGFDMDLFERKVSAKTRLIVINSPQNPTGGVLEKDQLGRIAEAARKYRIPVLADEIYKSFLYEGEFASITAFPGMKDLTIILDGFSKSYAMTGWRLGYGVMPRDLADHVARLMVNSNSCTAAFTQWAGIAALQGDQQPVHGMVAEFKRRRDIIVDGLNGLPGVTCRSPRGAFYVFPNVSKLGRPSAEIAEPPAQRGGRGGAGRVGLRRVRRGLPAPVLRQLRGQHPQGPGADAARARAPRRLTPSGRGGG